MAGIDTQKPYLAVYPWPVGFDQPDSPNYIPTQEIVQSCHGIGSSYHQWRGIRNLAMAGLAAEAIFPFTGRYKLKTLERNLTAIVLTAGAGLTAATFTYIRDLQYRQCVDRVGDEVQRRHDAEVKQNDGSAFWATTPFQMMGAIQVVGREVESLSHSETAAKVMVVGGIVIAAGAAVARLRCGFDTSGFSDLALKLSAL